MRRSVWMRVLAAVLIISMLAAPVSAAARRPSPSYGTNCIVGGIISIIRDIIRDIWDDWFDVPGDEDPEPTPPEQPTDPSEPTEPGETEPEDPTEPEETLKTVLNLIEGHANTANGHLLRGVTYSLSQVAEEQSKPTPGSLRDIKAIAIGAARAAAPSVQLNAAASSVQPMADTVNTEYGLTNWVDGGQYYIQSARADKNTSPNSYLKGAVSGVTGVPLENASLWTLDIVSSTVCYLSTEIDGTTYYLAIDSEAESLKTTASNLTITTCIDNTDYVDGDGNLLQICGVKYLNQSGLTTNYRGENSANDSGNAMWFYLVEGENRSRVTVAAADSSRDLPISVLTATAGDSQDGQGPGRVLDNNADTLWHTAYQGTSRDNHWIQFEISADYLVDGLRYQPRTSGSNGVITEYEIQVSEDGESFRTVATGNWANNNNWKSVQFPGEHVKYVRLVSKNALSDNSYKFASAAEIRLTGEVIETPEPEVPVEPEQPAIGSEVVFFPVTMFNYNNGISELNDDDIMRTLTHQAEVEAGLKEKWEGLYFSGGKPAPTSYTYTTEAASHSDLSWQQVIDGTYYADEACTNRIVVSEVIEGSTGYNETTVPVADIWDAFGGADVNTWYKTEYMHLYYGNYYPIGIRLGDDGYYYIGWEWQTDGYMQLGLYTIDQTTTVYAQAGTITGYTLVAGGKTLATLDGTDLTAKVGVPLYTAAGEVTVNKSYAEWNWWAYQTDGDAAQNKFYAGLVQDELVDGELKFNVVEPGIFTFDASDPTITNDGIKDIYQNVGLPFIKNEKGYYTFKSDAHGTYFADTNNDNKSDPWYGAEDDYFNMYFDYNQTQGWSGMNYGDGSTNLWAPFNTNANDTAEGNIDYHFGMRADIPFSMTPNGCIKSNDDNSEHITFTFQGDDDVWIFIDGHLVIDLGGIHNRLGATIDFADNTITYFQPESNPSTPEFGAYNVENFELVQKLYNDADGEGALGQTRANFSTVVDHEMSIFYLERGKGTSNCQIEFNLPMLDTVLVTKDITHSWSAEADERDGDAGDGTEKLTAKEQAAVDKLDFKFKLWKKEIGGRYTAVANTNYYLLDKDDNVLGIYTTGADGTFFLKNGQTAMFMTDLGNGTVTYAVEELDLDLDTFLTPDYKFAGLATDGFDFYGKTLNNDTEDENDTKTVSEHLNDASLIGEQELPMDAEQLVSYDVTPYGSIEAIESLEFICTNYLNAELPNPTARAYEDIIVIDYGLPVQVDPLHNDLFRGDDIEIVAWGDETLELNEVLESNQIYAVPYGDEGGTTWSGNKVLAAAYVSNGTTYSSTPVDMADCLYTFKKNADGTYEIFSTAADGTKVYLNHYTTDLDRVPNDSIPGKISVSESTHENMFRLLANAVEGGSGSNRTLHFHSDAAMPFWNRCGNDTSKKCSEYLYRPASANDQSSTEIPGYVMVTSHDEIKDGGQYLIVHDSDVDSNLYVLHPSTSNSQWDHVAKVGTTTSPAIGTSFSFDSGNVTFNDVTYAETTNADGTTTFVRDTFDYELTKQMTEVEEIRYIIKVNSTVEEEIGDEIVTKTACRYALGKIYIVPATIMYYEENFDGLVSYATEAGSLVGEQRVEAYVSDYQEPGVVGTVGDSTYGSDEAYECDPYDSNGTSYKLDTTNGYVRFAYSFTGTGTSFFARTSANTGYMQVMLFDGELTVDEAVAAARAAEQKDIWYRDTFYNDTNNTDLDGESLYNIPVFTNNELDYGTYTILVTVAKAGTQGAGPDLKSSGNEFYLDGIRVMQPLNESIDTEINEETGETITDKALSAYAADGESNLVVETLRQKLITDVEEGEAVWDGENFVVLTDTRGAITAAQDYISYGPKEEVYLAPGQKVTFSMKYWKPQGLKIYMGMKAPFGTVGTDDVGPYSAKLNVGKNPFTLRNATDCYYDVTDMQEKLEAVYIQAKDENGNLLFTDAEDNEIYMNQSGEFRYKNNNALYTGEVDELIPVDSEVIDYYVITYSFEATDSIVALTNIKVVGNFEFTIVEKNEETQDGPGSAEQ